MLVLLVSLALGPALAEERGATDWIAAVDARATELPGLRYSARRTTERGEIVLEERWRYQALHGSGSFRIDYFGDTARQVTCDGAVLVDYVPARGGARRFDLTRMDPADVSRLVGGILEKVAVPGFRVGRADVAWTLAPGDTFEGRPAVFLEGVGTGTDRLRYVVDRERLAVLRTEIERDGQVVLRTDSHDLREIRPGVWFPHEVRLRTPEAGGEVRVTLTLTKVAVLEDAPPATFQTVLDQSVPVEEIP